MDPLTLISDFGFLIWLVIALAVSYFTGSWFERRHMRSLCAREQKAIAIPLLTREVISVDGPIVETRIVMGQCVVAADYFKRTLARLKMMFGGNIAAYESLVDRARREAILRMREEGEGAAEIMALRIVTAELGKGQVEAVAYGTAVYTTPSGLPPQEFPHVEYKGSILGCLAVLAVPFLIIALIAILGSL